MTDDLAALRAVAEKATQGSWGVASVEGMGFAVHRGEHDTVALYASRDDAHHIATFDPPTILALLDRLETAEAGHRRWRELSDLWQQRAKVAESRLATLQQKLTDLADEWERADCRGFVSYGDGVRNCAAALRALADLEADQ